MPKYYNNTTEAAKKIEKKLGLNRDKEIRKSRYQSIFYLLLFLILIYISYGQLSSSGYETDFFYALIFIGSIIFAILAFIQAFNPRYKIPTLTELKLDDRNKKALEIKYNIAEREAKIEFDNFIKQLKKKEKDLKLKKNLNKKEKKILGLVKEFLNRHKRFDLQYLDIHIFDDRLNEINLEHRNRK